MGQSFLLILLLASSISFGQNQKWYGIVQVQPEITFHKDNYAPNQNNSGTITPNIGFSILAQHNFSKSVFMNAGFGYISRKLNSSNPINQSALPPPHGSNTSELVVHKKIAYRILSFPISMGYRFLQKEKFTGFGIAGISANYLLNTKYGSSSSKYGGTYKKNYWQGYSINLGAGAEYKLIKKIPVTASLTYAIVNKIKADEYIYNPQGPGLLTLSHNFLSINLGVKFPFRT